MFPTLHIRPSTSSPSDLDTVRALFTAYAASLPISLDFQDFAAELESLPGKYTEERGGTILLACSGSRKGATDSTDMSTGKEEVVGIVALRPLHTASGASSSNNPGKTGSASAELKRLFVLPYARGQGVAKALMDAVVVRAKEGGYGELFLDTLSGMRAARRLYEGRGFVETGAYYESVGDAVFYRLVL